VWAGAKFRGHTNAGETIDQPRAEAAEAGDQQLLAFEKKSPRRDDFRTFGSDTSITVTVEV
jgi:hypothetical protein